MDSRYYGPLRQLPLKAGSTYYLPELPIAAPVTLKSRAVEVMTDLRRIDAVTVEADTPMATAEQLMKLHGVRSLIVVDERRGVLGLVTATDILGEKPLALTFERGIRRHEITVQQIMTPAARLVVIEMNSVLLANVGNVLETLKQSSRQHALVVDQAEDGRHVIRGIFSTTQIARQLGITLQTDAARHSFAEIEKVMGP